ncbi:DNA sulfur modification protein DndD [Rhizobium sp. L1K21]|uniref:DNA sulfur modification protein DndD n=1 Tax=Rhizobium sp. L1K21 TaxID=2954933 RepID=UPI002091EA28|nr:DNA sulfur modification protein DndD [Rhizobium sp. L1K21]MCO6185210.1 DNA sulfur modification protein DndD [Rhizobium sp. L1K21]
MILKELTLCNFGLYGGENRFELSPASNEGRPVILVRGHNGGGKTTFLEAVRLALYGKRALGVRVARSDYETYLLRRINALAAERSAFVVLTFTRNEEGYPVEYEVRRAWAARGTSVIESIELKRNGALIEDIPPEDWDHYLEDMIPSGISQLFFFDGEKIQDIADGSSTDGLRDAIRSLLGLDLIGQLRSDLTVYMSRRNPSGSVVDLESIERDLSGAKADLVLLEEDAAQVRADREKADRQIAKAQKAFDAEGGAAALDRTALRQTLNEVEKRIDWLQGDLRRLAEGPLPLGLASALLGRLSEKLGEGGFIVGNAAIRDFLDAFESGDKAMTSNRVAWTSSHFSELRAFLAKATAQASSIKLDAEPAWIKGRIGAVNQGLKTQAFDLGKEFDSARLRQAKLKKQLRNLDEGAANETLETLKSAEYERGRAEAQLGEKEKAISSLRYRIEQLEKHRDQALEVKFDAELALHKMELGDRARAALAAYEVQVLERRVTSLSEHFVSCFNGLIRKKRLLSSVRIDPDTFDIALVGADGVEIPKEALSAGERQIFAISMLWALGKTSGRDLPMIIDTPLSRLDRAHRRSLMSDYVPTASQQIILLCTDSELTPDLDELVSPFVARRYEIGVVQGDLKTQVTARLPEVIYAH